MWQSMILTGKRQILLLLLGFVAGLNCGLGTALLINQTLVHRLFSRQRESLTRNVVFECRVEERVYLDHSLIDFLQTQHSELHFTEVGPVNGNFRTSDNCSVNYRFATNFGCTSMTRFLTLSGPAYLYLDLVRTPGVLNTDIIDHDGF